MIPTNFFIAEFKPSISEEINNHAGEEVMLISSFSAYSQGMSCRNVGSTFTADSRVFHHLIFPASVYPCHRDRVIEIGDFSWVRFTSYLINSLSLTFYSLVRQTRQPRKENKKRDMATFSIVAEFSQSGTTVTSLNFFLARFLSGFYSQLTQLSEVDGR